ncbi:hypothetical protein SASPL_141287 [Salvia splendens]|uniref:Myb/SANT-like domain-containing protein n=1 Tax=Salvia splendens TaxID=180675 RepID=A0A8X8WRJ8_SALSN|nr:hypothetical protein SASPL_141287 [Salvia splendens]
MNPYIPSQATFFYRGKWNEPMDTLLFSTMIKLHKVRHSNDESVPDAVLDEARTVFNLRFGSEITCADIMICVELLKVRFHTIKEVVATPGVCWDLDKRITVADDQTWKFIFRLIVITDSIIPNAPYHGRSIVLPVDLDEVKLPLINPSSRVRRKLFDETSTTADQMSPTMARNNIKSSHRVVRSKAPYRLLPVKELYSPPKSSS